MESARCKAFIESVERGSFRAAAEALGYTPSVFQRRSKSFRRCNGSNHRKRRSYQHTKIRKQVKPSKRARVVLPEKK